MSLYATPAALNADSYKSGHIKQYPEGTDYLTFNMTPRSDKYLNTPMSKDGAVVFGIQRFCQDYLIDHWNDTFFKRPKHEAVNEALEVMNGMLGEGAVSSEQWEELHDLGFLPIFVDAVPEGTVLPMKVPMLSFGNTLEGFGWVAGYLEDTFSNELWKATTIATIARDYRRLAENYAAVSCDDNTHVPYQFHDFSLRGLSGMTDGSFNSVAHLTSFKGTDNFAAVYTAKRVYGGDLKISDIAASVPATEHSVMVANIAVEAKKLYGQNYEDSYSQRHHGEVKTFERLMDIYPTGILSLVADSYDFWRTIGYISKELKDKISARSGKLVFRPDSGNPFKVICGLNYVDINVLKAAYNSDDIASSISKYTSQVPTQERFDVVVINEPNHFEVEVYDLKTLEYRVITKAELDGAIKTLDKIFGSTFNSKGFKEINPSVGLIYGDSITMKLADEILMELNSQGYAANNIVFGVGSYTYQYLTRDTLGFAVKATHAHIKGEEYLIAKDPITDRGLKKSAKGCVAPFLEDGKIVAKDGMTMYDYTRIVQLQGDSLFETVFDNGHLVKKTTLAEIRERINSSL